MQTRARGNGRTTNLARCVLSRSLPQPSVAAFGAVGLVAAIIGIVPLVCRVSARFGRLDRPARARPPDPRGCRARPRAATRSSPSPGWCSSSASPSGTRGTRHSTSSSTATVARTPTPPVGSRCTATCASRPPSARSRARPACCSVRSRCTRRSGGLLSFQFAHLLPALLAEAHLLGGDRLMFVATPMIGGVALLAFFVAAWRLFRSSFVALAALVSFAFLLPVISFSRDSYSEIPLQALVFTALWILDRSRLVPPAARRARRRHLPRAAASHADRRSRVAHRRGAPLRRDVARGARRRPPPRRAQRRRVRARP